MITRRLCLNLLRALRLAAESQRVRLETPPQDLSLAGVGGAGALALPAVGSRRSVPHYDAARGPEVGPAHGGA
jgi:hypothetical protein